MMPTSSTDLMPPRNASLVAIATGGVVGALAGYMLLTPEGRQLCRSIGEALEDVANESARFASSVRRAQGALSSSWNALGGGRIERQASGL